MPSISNQPESPIWDTSTNKSPLPILIPACYSTLADCMYEISWLLFVPQRKAVMLLEDLAKK